MSEMLYTKFSKQLDKELPHSYYPRMQLQRDSFLCLNGEWQFCINKESSKRDYNETILVPFPPESMLSGIGKIIQPDEYMHYRRKFTIPDNFVKDILYLHFGAVDQECDVYLNGKFIGRNEGGYIPFTFDITDSIIDGENILELDVKDAIDPKYPYGKQTYKRGGMWYTPVSGIWQTVWMESVPTKHIESIQIKPTMKDVTITVSGNVGVKSLFIEQTGEVFTFSSESITITPKVINLWSPENPFLYNFTIKTESDEISSYFALREIGIKKCGRIEKITLNGEPYLCQGMLDQGYYPDGIFTPATIDGYVEDISRTKKLGFNMLRKHIKIEPLIFYYLCDSMGMLVFQDMINNSDYSFSRDTVLPTIGIQKLNDKKLHTSSISREIFKQTMLSTIKHLYNSVCVVYYTIFNEGWGQFCADEMYRLAKSTDGTRIYDSTSGWFRRKESDVDSRHIYFKRLKMKNPDGRPYVISEFGGYSYRVEGHVFGRDNYGYRVFKSEREFEENVLALYDTEVRQLINDGASAFVYTQISDVEDETNGLITYDREIVKINPEKLCSLLSDLKQDFYKKS